MCEILEDGRYTTLIANPPYLGRQNFGTALKQFMGKFYSVAKDDLYSGFMVRARYLTADRGSWGMIVLPGWMSLSSFEKFRIDLLDHQCLETMVHFGRGLFGSDFGSVGFTFCNRAAPDDHVSVFRRLFERHVEVRSIDVIRRLFLNAEYGRYETKQSVFDLIPGRPIVYWASRQTLAAFEHGVPLGEVTNPRAGLCTGNNSLFVREWFEVSANRSYFKASGRSDAIASAAKWFPYNKGGEFRRWWGNQNLVVNWLDDGADYYNYIELHPGCGTRVQGTDCYFRPCVSWSNVSSGEPSFRLYEASSIFSHVGQAVFPTDSDRLKVLGYANSRVVTTVLEAIAPGTHFEVGQVRNLPWIEPESFESTGIERLIDIFRADWDSRETSWDFAQPPYLRGGYSLLQDAFDDWYRRSCETAEEAQRLETENNRYWADVYGLVDEVEVDVPLSRVSLTYNPRFAFAPTKGAPERGEEEYRWMHYQRSAREFISWAIGVAMGRYSVDVPGLVLAVQASSLDDFCARVAEPCLQPDDDGIIPVAGGAFDDDASRRVRAVLRVVFGASDLGDNIEFLTRCLAVKNGSNTAEFVPPVVPADPERALEDYMAKSFAADHQKDYSGRPVYWSLESPKGTFRALIYLHRYTPDTVGQVLTKYAAPFVDRLKAESEAVGRERDAVMGDDRKANRERARIDKKRSEIDAQIAEVQGFIDSVLQPLAQRRIHLELDDGVRINRLKLAYGWRSDLKDLPQPAIGAATPDVKKGIATDLKWARKEAEKNNAWWSE